jgi:hypothetical protein
MKIFLILFALLFFCNDLFAQLNLKVDASVNNLFRYGNGYEYAARSKYAKEYFENLTDARLSVNDIIFGVRYEVSDPIEFGLNFKGIRKRYIEYRNHDVGIQLRAGDYFDIVSRGLSLNVFEDRGLGYDTGIDGVRIRYAKDFGRNLNFRTQILGGDINYSDIFNPERIENYRIRSANVEFSPLKSLLFGLNYVHSRGRLPEIVDTTIVKTDLPEAYLNFNIPNFQFYASYAHKVSLVDPNTVYPQPITAFGDGFYSSVTFTKGDIGIILDYKNYRFDLTAPGNRSVTRPTRMLPYQNPPTAVREHTSFLISRNPHVVDFNDEVGGQVEIFYSLTDNLFFNLNTAIASRHYQYRDISTSGPGVYERVERSNSFLPSLDDAFSPFWEVYLEGEYYATEKLYTKSAFARQSQIVYNQSNPLFSEKLLITTIPVEARYSLTPLLTIKIIAEQQWVHNSIRIHQKSFTNQFISLNLTKSPNLGFTFNTEFTNDEEEQTGKSSWFLGEMSYKLSSANQVIVSYGSERGGLRCSNGICRYVNPFEGFRATIQTQF